MIMRQSSTVPANTHVLLRLSTQLHLDSHKKSISLLGHGRSDLNTEELSAL